MSVSTDFALQALVKAAKKYMGDNIVKWRSYGEKMASDTLRKPMEPRGCLRGVLSLKYAAKLKNTQYIEHEV